jgi:RimJ/RimL family protein N-acetyltransferase
MYPKGHRPRLVTMSEEHLPATLKWLTESQDLRRQIDCLSIPSQHGHWQYWQKKWSDVSREDYAILNAHAVHVGNCGLCDLDLPRRKAQLWIYLGDSYGAGNGTAAAAQLLHRAFVCLALNRVYLRVVAENLEALRFYERIGFVREGILRHDTIHEGMYVDSLLMAMLANDYLCSQRFDVDAP